MKKRFLSLALAVVLLLGCLPVTASAVQPEVSAKSNNADPFSLQQELYFKGTHVATIHLPQSWEGRIVTETHGRTYSEPFPSIACYSRICKEKREEMGYEYCGDGKLFTIAITSGNDWKNGPIPSNWVGSFQMDGVRYEVILLRVTDDRFNSTDPAIQEEARFFHGGYEQEVIDNIVFHVETGANDADEEDSLTIPYDLCTDTGEKVLKIWLPKKWGEQNVSVEKGDNAISFGFGETNLFQLLLSKSSWAGFPFLYRDIIGTITTADGRQGRIWFVCPNSKYPSFYPENTDFNSSTYQELRNDIPAILRSIEPNPELDWNWLLSDSGFTDVSQSAYYCNAVEWAVNSGVTSGTDLTRFSPEDSCTRAQAVTFLWRAAGEPEPAGGNTGFTDVKAGAYYEKAVRWAVEKGITAGTSTTKFSPNAKCTRAQIVSFLYRSAGSPSMGAAGSFRDVSSGDYYADAVAWAVQNNITAGTSDTAFSPNDRCTRAQIVTFLYRYSN